MNQTKLSFEGQEATNQTFSKPKIFVLGDVVELTRSGQHGAYDDLLIGKRKNRL
jgi:hypothetical protein